MKLVRFILLTFAIIIDGYAMSYLAKKIYVNSVEAMVVKIICSFDNNTHNINTHYKTTYYKNTHYYTNNEIIVCNTELKYEINGTTYNGTIYDVIHSQPFYYSKPIPRMIRIFYDKDNPLNITTQPSDDKIFLYTIFFIFLFIFFYLFFCIIYLILTDLNSFILAVVIFAYMIINILI